ncbi:hypothetical protein E1B28_010153 [Marasmius oreades]|uniref:Uncharacterized protein n=1 Tax=Marasmius oreades TaxID=181124 RepID=A0A9P7UR71_9AGAR|nr:uncharacterized protein E1B28_010153 [Marasmius oreades]KAG7091098.1 hypothetical protein E1B28_010153 [Marasmius oreades]
MSIGALLNEKDLQALSRQELQNLARTHEVKANSKSVLIVEQLLAKFPDGVPSVATPASKHPARKLKVRHSEASVPANNSPTTSSPLSSPPPSLQNCAPSAHEPIEANSNASPRKLWPPAPLVYEHGEDIPDFEPEEDPNAPSEYSFETNATPRSPTPTSPQPPCSPTAVKHAVETMRQVSEKDNTLYAQVEGLRTLADDLTHQATQLSQVLRREREARQRILTYMTHYIANNNRWGGRVQNDHILSEDQATAVREEYLRNGGRGWKDQGRWEFEEIWGGPIKVAQSVLPVGKRAADWVEIQEGGEQEYLNIRAEIDEEARRLYEKDRRDELWRKRYADRDGEDDEDENRYRPRRRLRAVQQLATESLYGLGVVDKGKRRMSANEVEVLQQEQSFQRLAEHDSLEAEEHLAREHMDCEIAARLAADECDGEEQEAEREAKIRQAREIAVDNARDAQGIHVVYGAVMKVAADILSGVEQWDSETQAKKRIVLEIGLERLNVLAAEDAAHLDIGKLAELAMKTVMGREGP